MPLMLVFYFICALVVRVGHQLSFIGNLIYLIYFPHYLYFKDKNS